MNLATIVKIKDLTPIEGADRIVLASMENNAWKVVAKINDFKIGDLGVYFSLDSIVDKDNPVFSFMESRHYRISNAKFKKQFSQGLLMPLNILDYYNIDKSGLIEGQDLTNELKVTKYEKDIPADLRGLVKGNFPTSLIPITDELNILSYPLVVQELDGKEVSITTKIDGTSSSFFCQNGEIDVCSRRLKLQETEGNLYWRIFNQYGLREKLSSLKLNICIQGESAGNGIQKNPLKLNGVKLFVFKIRNLDTQNYYTLDQMTELCNKLGLETVPILSRFVFDKSVHTIDWLQDYVNKVEYYKGQPCEGGVLAPVTPVYSNYLDKMLSVKCLNQAYKD